MAQEENKNRGLGSADEETRKRVSSEGGKASHSDDQGSESDSEDMDTEESKDDTTSSDEEM